MSGKTNKSPSSKRTTEDESSDRLLGEIFLSSHDAADRSPPCSWPSLATPVPTSSRPARTLVIDVDRGCLQFAPSLMPDDHDDGGRAGETSFVPPAPLLRTLSTPEPYRPLRHRAGSAFGNFRNFRGRSLGGSPWGSSAPPPPTTFLHQRSDPGVSLSAFHPVWSKSSVETESTCTLTCPTSSSLERDASEQGEAETTKKPSPPRLGSKLLSGIKGALKSRRRVGGRENPVSLLAEEQEDEEQEEAEDANVHLDFATGVGAAASNSEEARPSALRGFDSHAPFRAASVQMYSDSDLDDEIMEPIVGQYHLLDEEYHPRPPSVEVPSVEVIAEGLAGAASLTAMHVLEESKLRPPSVEPTTYAHRSCGDIPDSSSPAYHPLVDDHDDGDGEEHDDAMMTTIGFPLQLSYKSPKPSPDNSSKSHHSPLSHDSRLSGSHCRTAASGHSSQADYEVRETNRRSYLHSSREEVNVDLDGNATVHSSSTSSSNYHVNVHSPKVREGASMPGERFFAGSNVGGDGGEGDDLAEMNLSILSLGPNKPGNNGNDIMEHISIHARSHSPQTVSSASVSNTSSSGSEPKKPLKFVAIGKRAESPTKGLALDETPVSKRSIGVLIKPRISKGGSQRPPIQHFTSNQKPPQSPRKEVVRGSGARTPTRTPPRATTPSSPPVIVDGPNAMRGDLDCREGTKKPHGMRGSHGGLCLHPPSSESLYQQPQQENEMSYSSPLRDNDVAVLVDEGANDGAQEVFTASFVPEEDAAPTPHSARSDPSAVVTPEKHRQKSPQKWAKRQQAKETVPKKNARDCKKMQHVAVVSPHQQG